MSDLIVQNGIIGNTPVEDLPQCVYCGGFSIPGDDESREPLMLRIHSNGSETTYNVECGNCYARGPKALTEKDAVELYCRRHSPGLVEEVEAQQEALELLAGLGIVITKEKAEETKAAYAKIKKYVEEH